MTCSRQRTHRNKRAERSIAVLGADSQRCWTGSPQRCNTAAAPPSSARCRVWRGCRCYAIETVAVPAYFGLLPLYRASPMRIAVCEAATRHAPTAPRHDRPIQRVAACLAALGRPGRRTSPVFVSHRQRRKQIRQTKKPTLPASERGSLPALTHDGSLCSRGPEPEAGGH